MNKVRSPSSFSAQISADEEFQIKKQGFVSFQEKKVFNTWKKYWLVFKQMNNGTTPRVVLDAYGNESQFRQGCSPKHTFNLTGTVAPVVVCQQSHKQVRLMFVVCPPGSRYLFECDSHFGLESWVQDLNESLFPRTNGVDHILTELNTSIKLTGSIRNRAMSNSMNDISKIGSGPPEIPSAPPLPPPNKRAINAVTSFPVSPTDKSRNNSSSPEEAVCRYRVEVEVSTLSQVPKGVCLVLVQRESIHMCHAVTLDCMATWHITHIREFKLTNDDKLIITSGNRSVTGYGQVRLSGVDCRALYYKVKVFVRSKSKKPRTAVTLPDRKAVPLVLTDKSSTLDTDTSTNGLTDMMSPPESPTQSSNTSSPEKQCVKSSRPLPDIPLHTVYSRLSSSPPVPTSPTENYSRLSYPEAKSQWPQNETNPFANLSQSPPTETAYSQLSTDIRRHPQADDTYNVTYHLNNLFVQRNPCNSAQQREQNILDSLKHTNLIKQSKSVRKSEAYVDFGGSYSSDGSSNPYELESLSEIRKSRSLVSSQENKWHHKRTALSHEETLQRSEGNSDSDTEIPLTDNVAYGTIKSTPSYNIPVSPYMITKPMLPPKPLLPPKPRKY